MLLPACEDDAKPSDARQEDVCVGGRDMAGVDACAMKLAIAVFGLGPGRPLRAQAMDLTLLEIAVSLWLVYSCTRPGRCVVSVRVMGSYLQCGWLGLSEVHTKRHLRLVAAATGMHSSQQNEVNANAIAGVCTMHSRA
jgi:hypothetical protein